MIIGLLWLVQQALDVTHVGSHVLFEDAVASANIRYGLRLGALFDLSHLGVLMNFIYRSIRHANRTFREDDQ